MQNGLMICQGKWAAKNIGDYVQSLAAEYFFDKIDVLVEREALNAYKSDEKTKLIMNGWFMWNPENFPPSDDIEPLLISFHIVPDIAQKMLTPQSMEWFRKHAPVGCRDTGTQELLAECGIPAYFSGCLTLTLGEKYKAEKRTDKIIFTDPYFEKQQTRSQKIGIYLKSFCKSPITVIKIAENIAKSYDFAGFTRETSKKNFFYYQEAAIFYYFYSQKFENKLLQNAVFIKHDVNNTMFEDENSKLDYARNLLKLYAEAKLVITSRIHCALPCLALETPVIFTTCDALEFGKMGTARSKGRFGGLLELFHILRFSAKGRIEADLTGIAGKISTNTKLENKPDYLPIKDKLIKKCKEFAEKH